MVQVIVFGKYMAESVRFLEIDAFTVDCAPLLH